MATRRRPTDARVYLESIDLGAAPEARPVLLDSRAITVIDPIPNVENRSFLGRVVNTLSRTGVRQFLEIGAGYPAWGNVHEITARYGDDFAVVYVDHDPDVVAAWDQELSDKRVTAVAADLRDPAGIMDAPDVRRVLDFERPIAIMLVGVLHLLADADDPAAVIRGFVAAAPRGSYLVMAHATDQGHARQAASIVEMLRDRGIVRTLRSPAEFTALFDGLELLEPGVVPAPEWRPVTPLRNRPSGWILGGVARVP